MKIINDTSFYSDEDYQQIVHSLWVKLGEAGDNFEALNDFEIPRSLLRFRLPKYVYPELDDSDSDNGNIEWNASVPDETILHRFAYLIAGSICYASVPGAKKLPTMGAIKKTLNFFIDNGAKVNAQDGLGNTPLIIASKGWVEARMQLMSLFLEKDADVHLRNNQGKSALDYAILRCPMKPHNRGIKSPLMSLREASSKLLIKYSAEISPVIKQQYQLSPILPILMDYQAEIREASKANIAVQASIVTACKKAAITGAKFVGTAGSIAALSLFAGKMEAQTAKRTVTNPDPLSKETIPSILDPMLAFYLVGFATSLALTLLMCCVRSAQSPALKPQVKISNPEEESTTPRRKITECSFDVCQYNSKKPPRYQFEYGYHSNYPPGARLRQSQNLMPHKTAIQLLERVLKPLPETADACQQSRGVSHLALHCSDGRMIKFNEKNMSAPMVYRLLQDEYGFDGDNSPLTKKEQEYYEMDIYDFTIETVTPSF